MTEETENMEQFTDEDFKCSAAQFDVDYLEAISSEASADPNGLTRESLFVKFDPLVDKPALNSKTSDQLTKIPETDCIPYSPELSTEERPQLPQAQAITSFTSNLLGMDTPPKQQPGSSNHHGDAGNHPLTVSHMTPINLDMVISNNDMTTMAQAGTKKMYTEDQVAEMIEAVKKEEIEATQRKYGPQIAALEKELSSVEQKPDQLYNECMFLDSIQTSQQSLLEQKVLEWKLFVAEHERLETLIVCYHEKLKEKYMSLAEQRDATLKSEKFKVKSFEELRQRYMKLQDAIKKIYQFQCGLSSVKRKSKQVTANLLRITEESLTKQDELNLSCEAVQKDHSSKIAVERAQSRTIELQVSSMENDIQQKEQEKQQLTQIAEELMKELRNVE